MFVPPPSRCRDNPVGRLRKTPQNAERYSPVPLESTFYNSGKVNDMDRSKLKAIECRGSPREIGRQYGEQAREEIRENEYFFAGEGKIEDATGFVETARRLLSSRIPDIFEEMEGIAEGSGVPLDSIILFNQVNTFGNDWTQDCTTIALRDSEDGPLLGKNNDGGMNESLSFIIRKLIPSNGFPMIQITYAGWVSGLDAMNAAGLANGHNSVGSIFDKSSLRIDIRLRAYQLMKRCEKTSDFITGLSETSLTGKGFNIVVVDRYGETAAMEAAVPLIAWRDLNKTFIYATNHYITPALKEADMRSPYDKDVSIYRYGYLRWIEQTATPKGIGDIKRLLRSHEPWAPCRHGGPHNSKTLWSIIEIPKQNKMLIASGAPCAYEYEEFDLNKLK